MEFKNKNNNALKKQEVLDFIFKTVDGRLNPVDLKNADLYVIVEVYRDLLMIGVVPNYKEMKKYNLQSLIRGDKAGEDSEEDGKQPPRKVIKLSELIGKRERGELDDDFKKPGAAAEEDASENESDSDHESDIPSVKGNHKDEESSGDEEIRLI